MGFGRRFVRRSVRRAVRKSVRHATPRPVRKATHPVRTARNAATPRPVKQASRAAYTVRHPVGAAENKVVGAALNSPKPRRSPKPRPSPRPRRSKQDASPWVGFVIIFGVILGLVLLIVNVWLALGVIVLALVVPAIVQNGMAKR